MYPYFSVSLYNNLIPSPYILVHNTKLHINEPLLTSQKMPYAEFLTRRSNACLAGILCLDTCPARNQCLGNYRFHEELNA